MNPAPARLRYVGELEELLKPADYDHPGCARLVRLRLRRLPGGRIELLADSPDPQLLDQLFLELADSLGIADWEALLCG